MPSKHQKVLKKFKNKFQKYVEKINNLRKNTIPQEQPSELKPGDEETIDIPWLQNIHDASRTTIQTETRRRSHDQYSMTLAVVGLCLFSDGGSGTQRLPTVLPVTPPRHLLTRDFDLALLNQRSDRVYAMNTDSWINVAHVITKLHANFHDYRNETCPTSRVMSFETLQPMTTLCFHSSPIVSPAVVPFHQELRLLPAGHLSPL
ncbi:hypothetical protein J6590_078348 [Homalodisca vitripennis]|nr:hypothetical protein J6590_078348 [Homalodisca vitripennis]